MNLCAEEEETKQSDKSCLDKSNFVTYQKKCLSLSFCRYIKVLNDEDRKEYRIYTAIRARTVRYVS